MTFVDEITQLPSLLKIPRIVQCSLRKKFKSRSVQCTLLEDNFNFNPECEVIIEEQSLMEYKDTSFSTSSDILQMSEYSQSSKDNALYEIAKISEEMKNCEVHVQNTLSLCRNKSKLYREIDSVALHIIDILSELLLSRDKLIYSIAENPYPFEQIDDMFGTYQPHITQKFKKVLPKNF